MAQRDAKKAYQSRMQQQERLAIRYLKIGQSSQCPYYKGIKIIFQNYKKNLNLSQERAQSVASYLLACGVSTNQIKSVQGMGEANPIADNSTAAGRQENRRVEIYLYASQQMIQQAEAGTL